MAINTLPEIVDLLKDTFLADAQVLELEIPESKDRAFAIQINPENGYAAWNLMYSQIDKTGRYPVIVRADSYYPVMTDDGKYEMLLKNWEDGTRNSTFFSRTYYEEDRNRAGGIAPSQIIERSKSFDVDKYIAAEDEDFLLWQFDEEEIEDILIGEIESLEEKYGKAPEIEEFLQALGLSDKELGATLTGEDINEEKLERWLFEWELASGDYEKAIIYNGIIRKRDWFGSDYYKSSGLIDTNQYSIILFPTKNSWEVLAYMHWYGSLLSGSDGAIAFLKRWHDNYQAELVCHFGTVLNLNVGKRPQTPMEAFNLMVEQYTLSDYDMRHNFSMREYALYLMKVEHWCFHERP
jgi:Domain of unknown function (DUF4253)